MESESDPSTITKASELTEEPEDALQYLSYARAKLKRKLDQNNEDEKAQHFDLEQTIREIRTIITVNDEIYDEIFSHCIIDVRTSTKDNMVMKRFGFKKITRLQVDTFIELSSFVEIDENTFEATPPTRLPKCMNSTISINYKKAKFTRFIDYIMPTFKRH